MAPKADAPSFHRNVGPIGDALVDILAGMDGELLEIGSGTGQHAAALAARLPMLRWRPSDADPANIESISAWTNEAGAPNLAAPIVLDASAPGWGLPDETRFTAILCVNVVHIAPWSVAEGLFAGAGARLTANGKLILYGPYTHDGAHIAQSNADFDAWLRARNPAWGVRDIADLAALGARAGLVHTHTRALPANNHILVFARAGLYA